MRVAVLLAALFLPACSGAGLPSDPASVVSIEVREEPTDGQAQPPRSVRTNDPEVIRAILAALRPTGNAPSHKCGARGRLVVTTNAGRTIDLWVLPGHDSRYYEYGGRGRPLRVDREPFLSAMARLGAGWLPRDCP